MLPDYTLLLTLLYVWNIVSGVVYFITLVWIYRAIKGE